MIDLMREEAKVSSVICVDQTPIKLLKPELNHAATAHLWTLVGDESHPYNVYYFTESRSRAGPESFLENYNGTLVSDAYVAYESLQKEWSDRMTWACCHAHASLKKSTILALRPQVARRRSQADRANQEAPPRPAKKEAQATAPGKVNVTPRRWGLSRDNGTPV